VNYGSASEGITERKIVYRRMGGADLTTVNGNIVLVRSVWLVFAVEQGVYLWDLEDTSDAIHAALHQAPISSNLDGRLVLSCLRESEFDIPVLEGGVEFQRLGGVYVVLSATA
jgi:hypothetical protein